MDILRKSILIAAALLHLCYAIAFANDSIPTKELQEVQVVGERAWISEDGTINFIPSRKEKNFQIAPVL